MVRPFLTFGVKLRPQWRTIEMPSRVIRRFSYQAKDKALDVTFVSGRCYRYLNVPQQVYQDMQSSFSKGEYFNRHVRDHFAFEKLTASRS